MNEELNFLYHVAFDFFRVPAVIQASISRKGTWEVLFFPETRDGLQRFLQNTTVSHPSLSSLVLHPPFAEVAKQEPTAN